MEHRELTETAGDIGTAGPFAHRNANRHNAQAAANSRNIHLDEAEQLQYSQQLLYIQGVFRSTVSRLEPTHPKASEAESDQGFIVFEPVYLGTCSVAVNPDRTELMPVYAQARVTTAPGYVEYGIDHYASFRHKAIMQAPWIAAVPDNTHLWHGKAKAGQLEIPSLDKIAAHAEFIEGLDELAAAVARNAGLLDQPAV